MRHFITLSLCIATTFQALATRISEENAYQKASEFANGKTIHTAASPTGPKKAPGTPSSGNYYIYNIGDDEGFVIISGVDNTRSILGYSDKGSFDIANIPSNMQWLLNCYDSAIEAIENDWNLNSAKKVGNYDKATISPLLTTQWGQNAPYNNHCPTYQGKRCVTGCVATAIAQQINYFKWPQSMTASIPGYTSVECKIDMPTLPPKMFDWNNLDENEIAELMLYCGQAVNMNYTPEESGASTALIPHALTDLFNFSKGALYVERSEYSNDEWMDMIYDQLQLGYPVLYTGRGASSGRHLFILDGYDDGMYHVNWGWEGQYDGHFALDLLEPYLNSSFSLYQYMISYACPPVNVSDTEKSKIVVHNISCNKSSLRRADKNSAFPKFEVKSLLASDLTEDYEVQIGFALCNDEGVYKVLVEDSFEFWTTDNDIDMTDDVYITPDIPQGNYRLIAVNRVNDSDEWLPDSKSHARYIDVTITDTELQLQNVKKGKDGIETIEFGPLTVDGLNYRLVSEYDVLRAYLQPAPSDAPYSGEITIPEFVEYDKFKYKVFGEEGTVFTNNDKVTSISSPIALKISNCQNLREIIYRDGVLNTQPITGCPKLTRINCPSSCRHINQMSDCPELKELSFNNLYPINFSIDGDGQIWTQKTLPALSDIYFYGDEPPTMPSESVSENPNLKIHVPDGLKEAFEACGWQNWNVVEDLDKVAESVKWDYIGYDEDCDEPLSGYSGNNDVEFAIKITAEELEKYIGNQIVAIEYFSTKPTYKDNETRNPDYVFITENDKDYVAKQATTAIRGSWTRVILEQPYEINGEEVFIGVGRHRELTMNWANLDPQAGGFWYRAMGNDHSEETPGIWLHNCDEPDFNYPMPIRAIIQGETLPSDIAILKAEYNADEEKPLSESGKIKLNIRNRSPRLMKSTEIELCYDGKRNETATIVTSLPAHHSDVVEVCPEELWFNTHFIDMDIVSIDGNQDAIQSNSKETITLLPTDIDHYPRVTVMEEYTSSQDGSCSRGIATKEYMKKNCGDDFISISIHSGDDMLLKDGSYDEFLKQSSPTYFANINRKAWSFGYLSVSEVKNLRNIGESIVRSEATYTKDGRISIATKSSFSQNHDENENFNISYVLIEDHVGPFIQKNNASNPSAADNPNDYMNWWTHQDKEVTYEFQDVARTIHTYEGFDDLFPVTILKDEVYDANYCMKIPDYIQNAENLKIVTLLIDKSSGEILNAHITEISGETPDFSPELGDSNGNGEVNIADAVNIANYVVGNEVEKFHYTASDVNNDGNLSFSDAAATVSLILAKPAATLASHERIGRKEEYTTSDCVHLYKTSESAEHIGTSYISLDNAEKYVALQADILLPENTEVDAIKLGNRLEKTHRLSMRQVDEKTIRIIIFDLNTRAFTESDDPIMEITLSGIGSNGDVEIRNIIASDANAHDYVLSFEGETSGTLGLDDDLFRQIIINPYKGALEIMNAQSKRIIISSIDGKTVTAINSATDFERIELPTALYIVQVGNVTEKVIVK